MSGLGSNNKFTTETDGGGSDSLSSHSLGVAACLADDDLAELFHLGLVSRVGKHVEDLVTCLRLQVTEVLEALSANAPRQVDVLLHDGDSLGMDGTKVGIFEEAGEIALSCLLKCK